MLRGQFGRLAKDVPRRQYVIRRFAGIAVGDEHRPRIVTTPERLYVRSLERCGDVIPLLRHSGELDVCDVPLDDLGRVLEVRQGAPKLDGVDPSGREHLECRGPDRSYQELALLTRLFAYVELRKLY